MQSWKAVVKGTGYGGGRNRFSLGESRDPQQFVTSLRADSSNFYLNIGTHKHKMGERKKEEIPKVSKADICKPFHHWIQQHLSISTSMYLSLGHVSIASQWHLENLRRLAPKTLFTKLSWISLIILFENIPTSSHSSSSQRCSFGLWRFFPFM